MSHEVTGYPVGEKHAFLAFLRQPAGSDHNWDEAQALLVAESWGSISFGRAGTLGPESTVSAEMDEMRKAALANGGSVIIYSDAGE